jgi:hypothetical protein
VYRDHRDLRAVALDRVHDAVKVALAGDHAVPRRFHQPDGGLERFGTIVGHHHGQRLLR